MTGEQSQPVYQMKEGGHRDPCSRDGTRLCVDVCRPDAGRRFLAPLTFSRHNKFLQSMEVAAPCHNEQAIPLVVRTG